VTDRATGQDSGSAKPDPVGELYYQVKIENTTIGYFTECSGISVEYDVTTLEEGGTNEYVWKLRGRAKHPNLVLKRGVTHETALLDWFTKCQVDMDYRTVQVALKGPDGKTVRAWAFGVAWPAKWTGPSLKGGSNSVATETLEIAYHGFTEVKAGS
jgi:phage tail-like protein